ncbi:hypothetical protein BHM03_00046612, partial [Ensete ventricosum]
MVVCTTDEHVACDLCFAAIQPLMVLKDVVRQVFAPVVACRPCMTGRPSPYRVSRPCSKSTLPRPHRPNMGRSIISPI